SIKNRGFFIYSFVKSRVFEGVALLFVSTVFFKFDKTLTMNLLTKKTAFSVLFFLFAFQAFSQTYNWTGYPANATTWNPSTNFHVTTSTAGGGSFDRRESGTAALSPISSTDGSQAQNCGTYTGLRLEMSGAGNS